MSARGGLRDWSGSQRLVTILHGLVTILDDFSDISDGEAHTGDVGKSQEPTMTNPQLITLAIAALYVLHALAEWRHW